MNTSNTTLSEKDRLVRQQLVLRRIIGIIGMGLPFILWWGTLLTSDCDGVQSSISHYYYTSMGNVFTGILFAVGFFLLAYQGYARIDNILGDIAFLGALGVALFPTSVDPWTVSDCVPEFVKGSWKSKVHFFSAGALFVVLGWFSFFLFVKTKDGKPATGRKRTRNQIYKTCGIIIWSCVALLAAFGLMLDESTQEKWYWFRPVFTLETIALLAFGFSWFLKGDMILRDIKS